MNHCNPEAEIYSHLQDKLIAWFSYSNLLLEWIENPHSSNVKQHSRLMMMTESIKSPKKWLLSIKPIKIMFLLKKQDKTINKTSIIWWHGSKCVWKRGSTRLTLHTFSLLRETPLCKEWFCSFCNSSLSQGDLDLLLAVLTIFHISVNHLAICKVVNFLKVCYTSMIPPPFRRRFVAKGQEVT